MDRHIFHISGMKIQKTKSKLLQGIKQLGGEYIGGSVYNERITHLIVSRAIASEKFVAACAQGKWIVTPEYVMESVKKGWWLPEGPYELRMAPQAPGLSNPVCVWRERVACGVLAGAFEGWVVLLMIEEPGLRDMFTRILTAGKARVYSCPPPSQAAVTHMLTYKKHVKSYCAAPCYSVHHIAQHLFGKLCCGMGVPWTEAGPAEEEKNSAVSSILETEARDSELEAKTRESEMEAEPRDSGLEAKTRESEMEAEPRDSEMEADSRDSELMIEISDSELETKTRDSELMIEISDSELEIEISDSELETETRESELKIEISESELETETRDSELKIEISDSELETETRDSELKIEISDSELETETRDSELETKTRDSELMIEISDSELEIEISDSELETETRDSEMKVEPRDSEMEAEPRKSEMEAEPRDSEMKVEPRDSEMEAEPRKSEMEAEPRDSEMKAEPRDSEMKAEPRDSEMEAEPRKSELEMELMDYILKAEGRKRLVFPEFLSYQAPSPRSQTRTVASNFHTLKNLIECGGFMQALEDVQSCLFPGALPSVPSMASLMLHALQGKATCSFLAAFWQILYRLLRNNPSWASPTTTKYFSQLLQCPECKSGLWSLLDTSIRYCMSSEATSCHSLPSPASPELLRFHGNLQKFVLKLFQWELHSANSGGSTGLRTSVLYGSFWNVWERLTLGSRPVRQLAQLLVQATVWELSVSQGEEPAERERGRDLALVLQDMLSSVVEYWCQTHGARNRVAVEQGLADLAEHIAVLCQDLSPDVLTALVPRMPSARLKMVTADAVFRSLCSRSGLVMGAEPLTLRKILTSYLPALGRLAGGRPGGPGAEPASHSWTHHPGSGPGMLSAHINGTNPGRENRGLNRVNAVGETLLHTACKRNDVKTLLQILAVPGTDVDVKDHAGWTPVHEACNHGSAACVEALLRHAPYLRLTGQVDGISPVHDALLHRHMDIAKMLLEHAGSSLLQQRDRDGRTAMDLVPSATQREELRSSAAAGDRALDAVEEVRDPASLEAGSCLLACLLACYPKERGVPLRRRHAPDGAPSLGSRLAGALESRSLQRLTAGWADPRLVRVAEDAEAALGAGPGVARVCLAVRRSQGAHTRFLLSLLEVL